MRKKGYVPEVALQRTQEAVAAPESDVGVVLPPAPPAAGDGGIDEPEYGMISVWKIDPGALQSRLVFKEIEELAESIRGDGITPGVGIVEPILVRATEGGRYDLLDGERRWRAAKLIANERPEHDYLIPARVFDVSDSTGTMIGQAANIERDAPRPLELVLSYRKLKEALEKDAHRSVGIRKIAGAGWHKRSQVRDYLAIGDRVTTDVLKAAGVMDTAGRVDEAVVTRLTVTDLLAVANAGSDDERISTLRVKADRARGLKPVASKSVPEPTPSSPEERLVQMRDTDGLSIRVRAPLRTLAPAAARQLLSEQLSPAMLATVEQAEGHASGEGYHADFRSGHTVFVLPREVERLSAAQLETLSRDLVAFAKRVRRAARFHRGQARRVSGQEATSAQA